MRIAVLLSGGVDSSVALHLLKEAGHDVTAFYLKIWLEEEINFIGDCPWEEDMKYVRAVCEQEKIQLEIIPLQKEYFDTIVAYTLDEICNGRTPNPDVMCNNHIKFGLFIKKIDAQYKDNPFDKVASGHYAQLMEVPSPPSPPRAEQKNSTYYLKKSPDPIKDQTYFLSRLSQDQLSRIVFPIGHLSKKEVRTLAQKYDLPNKDRKDSQGICFIGKFKFRDFIKHYLGEKEGEIREYESGKVIGTHQGCWFYTIGQRNNIRLSGGPWFVVKKDLEKNIVFVSRTYEEVAHLRDTFNVTQLEWVQPEDAQRQNITVKIRHGQTVYQCEIDFEDDKTQTSARITIPIKDQGIAPGQIAAFYDGDILVGSGIIDNSEEYAL